MRPKKTVDWYAKESWNEMHVFNLQSDSIEGVGRGKEWLGDAHHW